MFWFGNFWHYRWWLPGSATHVPGVCRSFLVVILVAPLPPQFWFVVPNQWLHTRTLMTLSLNLVPCFTTHVPRPLTAAYRTPWAPSGSPQLLFWLWWRTRTNQTQHFSGWKGSLLRRPALSILGGVWDFACPGNTFTLRVFQYCTKLPARSTTSGSMEVAQRNLTPFLPTSSLT